MATNTGFISIDRERAFEIVVQEVERSIADGRYEPGQRLPSERDLAESFGVSRVVIREAMRALESRGYVSVRQGSGAYVLPPEERVVRRDVTLSLDLKESSLVELYVVRQSLELSAVRLTAQHASPRVAGDLDVLVAQMGRLAEVGIADPEEYMAFSRLDEGFHLAIAAASENRAMSSLLGAVLPLFTLGRKEIMRQAAVGAELFSAKHLALVVREHADIAVAVRNRDSRAAEYFMYGHMQRSIASWVPKDERTR